MNQSLVEFKSWLTSRRYTQKTIGRASQHVKEYLAWMHGKELRGEDITYKLLLDYIETLQTKGKSKALTNDNIRSISLYNRSQQIEDVTYNVRLRGVTTSPPQTLSEDEINRIYECFTPKESKIGYYHHSDKLILSLMIYQGITPTEILHLKLENIDLLKGVIFVAKGVKLKNERIIPLEAHQILPFSNYINKYRVSKKDQQSEQSEQSEPSDKLFMPNCEHPHRFKDQLRALSKAVKLQAKEKCGINVSRLNQLIQSRLVIWLRQHGIRKAQYLMGYRRIENIQRYQKHDISDLQQLILELHPLNEMKK